MTSRERIMLALQFEESDRVAIQDSPWGTTIRRWHREGLPAGKSPGSFFNYEMASIGADLSLRLPTETMEETDNYAIVRNSNGVLRKNWKNSTSTPELLGFTVDSSRAWEEHKPRLKYDESRVNWDNALAAYTSAREKGFYVRSLARELGQAMGTGGHCASIRRIAVGPFTIDQAVGPDDFPEEIPDDRFIPLAEALRMLESDS